MIHAGEALAALLVVVLGLGLVWRALRDPRRGIDALTDSERAHLRRLPWDTILTPVQRDRLARQVAAFLHRKDFYGCNGLVVDPQMALTIAGMACLLTIHRETPNPYPRLRSVLVYPDAFTVHHDEPDELGLVNDDAVELLGESWDSQRVILSWAQIGEALAGSPVNVVAHEFAHQIDDEAGQAEGAPPLSDYTCWAQVMSADYARLRRRGSPVLNDYGATSPAEFFAVAVEAYLQRGAQLRAAHPDLFSQLREVFGLATEQMPGRAPGAHSLTRISSES